MKNSRSSKKTPATNSRKTKIFAKKFAGVRVIEKCKKLKNVSC